MTKIRLSTFVFFLLLSMSTQVFSQDKQFQIFIEPANEQLVTKTIQQAIDSCAATGGGTVIFRPGTYISGTIVLKNKVALHFEKGSVLRGSTLIKDYTSGCFIQGRDLSEVMIDGEGIIDGVDCYNPHGEEGFRGPHCIRLTNCKNISIKEITIKNAGNYAILCWYCTNGAIENVTILAGHDGLHTNFCTDFKISGCDFRTGDDSFAGNDNTDFAVTDCKVNSSCNCFRFGCMNFTVKNCRLWGPGQYVHKIEHKAKLPNAFTHFSPRDRKPKSSSGNWLIQDVIIENVAHVYFYNFENGLWQTGQPATTVKFDNVKATGILNAFYIIGDKDYKFDLQVQNSSFSFADGQTYKADLFEGVKMLSNSFFYAERFNKIELTDVLLKSKDAQQLMECKDGKSVVLNQCRFVSGNSLKPFVFEKINEEKVSGLIYNNRKM